MKKSQFYAANFPIIGDCSHCYLHPDVHDGPCKVFSKDERYCVNMAETRYCSETAGTYSGKCSKRTLGYCFNEDEINQAFGTFLIL